MPKSSDRSYSCYYTPKDAHGHLAPSDTGALPFVQVLATSAEHAFINAHHVTGCPVSEVVRIEQAA
ncbi:hypothetical protein [Variovorax atrisoli]|uniref:hypothetical protein n=1 Tax=Variovorax atrisoli TaxID=3394203 RepID=UPI00403FD094